MIEPPVVLCDMCQQRYVMDKDEYREVTWLLPDRWSRKTIDGTRFDICPNESCIKLFCKQCEEMPEP